MKPSQNPRSRVIVEDLEPRILYSADLNPYAQDAGSLGTQADVLLVEAAAEQPHGEPGSVTSTQVSATSHEIVFIDQRVENYEQLVADAQSQATDGRDIEVVVLWANESGIEQITRTLSQYQDLSAVHIISHGSDANLQLGNTALDFDNLLKSAPSVKQWGNALAENGDILLYGCDVAEGTQGKALVDALARLTGADVAASDDLTGSAASAADWDLEYQDGRIEAKLAIGEAEQTVYDATLAAPVLDNTKSPALTAVNEDAGAPSGAVGSLVSSLVDFATPAGQVDNVTDPDGGAVTGIAVVAADTTNGTWWYSTNGGANWNALGAVSASNARLLAADANTRIYFQPSTNYFGTLANAITFRAWDQITGTNGATAPIANGTNTLTDNFNSQAFGDNDGTQAWSTNWIESDSGGAGATTGNLQVTASPASLQTQAKSAGDNIYREADISRAVSATLSFSYNNVSVGNPTELVVQISGDGGANYTTLKSYTAKGASGTDTFDITSYISANTRVRFYIVSGNPGNNDFYVDDLQITYLAPGGGTMAFSAATDIASHVINPIADTPSVSIATTNEDTQTASGLVISRTVPQPVSVASPEPVSITEPGVPVLAGALDAFLSAKQFSAASMDELLVRRLDVSAPIAQSSNQHPLANEQNAVTTAEAMDASPWQWRQRRNLSFLLDDRLTGSRAEEVGLLDHTTDSKSEDTISVLLKPGVWGGVVAGVGAAWWAGRSGLLLASVMGGIPAWARLDPLPIVFKHDTEGEEDAGSSAKRKRQIRSGKVGGGAGEKPSVPPADTV